MTLEFHNTSLTRNASCYLRQHGSCEHAAFHRQVRVLSVQAKFLYLVEQDDGSFQCVQAIEYLKNNSTLNNNDTGEK